MCLVLPLIACYRNNKSNNEQQKESGNEDRVDDNGLIMPKKLANPNLDSSSKKNLHKELMFNQKR